MKPQDLQTLALAALTASPARWSNAAEPAAVTAVAALAAKVDRLGLIRATLDSLAKEADDIRDELESAALATIEGKLYRASFSQVKGAERTDWKAIAERLKPSPQLIRAHTKQAEGYTRLSLTAKPAH